MSIGEDPFEIPGFSPAKRALLAHLLAEEGIVAPHRDVIPRREGLEAPPLSYAQHEIWNLGQWAQEPIYNSSYSQRLHGALDVDALERALNEIVRRHEVLRTRISIVDGKVVQQPQPPIDRSLPVSDLRELPRQLRETRAEQLAAEFIGQRFDLSGDSWFRYGLLRLADQDHVLLLVLHELATDHWSQGILFRELATLYDAFKNGRPSPLGELPIQCADFAVWQRERLTEEFIAEEQRYWHEQLRDMQTPNFPTDFSRPSAPTYRAAKIATVLPDHLSESLFQLSRRAGGTWFMTLLAAFEVLFQRHTGQDEVAVGIPVAGRDRIEIEGLIGFFLNTLLLRTSMSGNPTFNELLKRVQATASGAFAHQEIPFAKVIEDLQVPRNPDRTPLFQALFNVYEFEETALELTGISSSRFSCGELATAFDMTLYVRRMNGKVHLTLKYKADLYRAERMAQLLKQYTDLLSQVVADPDANIQTYSLPSCQSVQREAAERPVSTNTPLPVSHPSQEPAVGGCVPFEQDALPEPTPFLHVEPRPLLSLLATKSIGPVDAAAFGYLSDQLLLQTGASREDVREAWCHDLPNWTHVVETSLGRIGLILLPWFGSELYDDQPRLVDDACHALELASSIGARAVSLTGLIPSATDYGRSIAVAAAGRPGLPVITTGHASTVATVVLTIKRIMEETNRDLMHEHVGFLGLGSIGRSTLGLMLQCLPHPDRITLCDVYGNVDDLKQLQRELVQQRGFQGEVRIVTSRGRTPSEFYEASFVVGATNVPRVLDVQRLRPGTIIVDDSGPHCFSNQDAITRLKQQRDILFTEGGVLESPERNKLTRHCPPRARDLLTAKQRQQLQRYNPYDITGCVLSSLLTAGFDEIEPNLGIVDDQTALRVYKLLSNLGYQAAEVHCRPYISPRDLVAEFRSRFGGGKARLIADSEDSVQSSVTPGGLVPAERSSGADPQRAPVSVTQERMLYLDRLQPNSAAYNISMAFRISGNLDVSALEETFSEIVRRHEALRTTFSIDNDGPVQLIHGRDFRTLTRVSLEDVAKLQQEAEVERFILEEARRPFNLTQGPLMRTTLLILGDDEYVLLVSVHHIVFDGGSRDVILQEISELYERFSTGGTPKLDLPVPQYQQFARWQRQYLESEEIQKKIAYWKQQLEGVPEQLDLPTDRPRPKVQTLSGGLERLDLTKTLSDGLRALGKQENATLFMVLLAAFKTLLRWYTRQDVIVVGSPASNRDSEKWQSTVGYFANSLVLRTDLRGNPTFRQVLAQVRDTVWNALEHESLPFATLIDELQPERDLGRNPVFQTMFSFRENAQTSLALPGLSVTRCGLHNDTSKVDLTFRLASMQQGFAVHAEYNAELFDGATIERMLAHYQTLLESVVAEPNTKILDLSMLTDQERQRILVQWNDTATELPPVVCVQQLVEEQAERTPRAVAVVFEEAALTYRELNERANQLAHHLQSMGVESGSFVGICVERSAEMLVAMLGILKAGAAYVPLDPSYPPDRREFMVKDAQIGFLVTHRQTDDVFRDFSGQLVWLDRDREFIASQRTTNPQATMAVDQTAYLIYTSGSTGRPKGVAISHRALINLLCAMRRQPGLTADDVLVAVSSLSFDIATMELLLPLMVGAQVVLASRDAVVDGHQLAELLAATSATALQGTPATWQMLLAADWPGQPQLKALCGGEALPRELANSLVGRVGSLWNLYGPTEATIYSTCCEVAEDEGPVLIGRPIANTEVYVLNERLQPVPIGVPGELYIGGEGLAGGYLNRPELTATTFVPNPFGKGRMYKTGDLVRWRADGNLVFLGRTDDQIKVRGFRVEPAEIESLLMSHEGVRRAVVVPHEFGDDDQRLVAYVVADRVRVPTPDELRDHLKQYLPHFMVPSAFVTLDELPLTPNGKVDRKLLSSGTVSEIEQSKSFVPPRDRLETDLVRIWQDLLLVEPIGVTDNFFDLGGHSLIAMRMVARIENHFKKEFQLQDLLQAPTVEELAGKLRERLVAEPPSNLVGVWTSGSRRPVYFVHPAGGNVVCYGSLSRHLGRDQPFYAIAHPAQSGDDAMFTRIEDYATYYLAAIRAHQSEGPYRLGGWSFGGVVAFEMARQLEIQGQKTEMLALLDSAPTLEAHGDAPTDLISRLAGFARAMAFTSEDLVSDSPGFAELALDEQLLRILEMVGKVSQFPIDVDPDILRRYFQVYESNLEARLHYAPQTYAGKITVYQATDNDTRSQDDLATAWARFARGGVERVYVPGDHYTILSEPNVKFVAEHLGTLLRTIGG